MQNLLSLRFDRRLYFVILILALALIAILALTAMHGQPISHLLGIFNRWHSSLAVQNRWHSPLASIDVVNRWH